jgi:outer membrane putative beta-barrel porin/alpha-amylase
MPGTALGLGLALLAAADPIQVNPNRPTFATPAQTTQRGVAELELGVQDTALRDDLGLFFTPYLQKVGLLSNLELRVGGNGYLRATAPEGRTLSGFGDLSLGTQWRFLHDGPLGFDYAVQASWKLPTGSVSKGLGSGQPDRTLMALFSRDFGRFHADVNVLETWLGRPTIGHDSQPAGTVSISGTLGPRWSITGELYTIGRTSSAAQIVSNLWALAFKVSPRLVLDGGADVGLSQGAPRLSVFTGLTVGLARLYR